jgi:hypothetical protein
MEIYHVFFEAGNKFLNNILHAIYRLVPMVYVNITITILDTIYRHVFYSYLQTRRFGDWIVSVFGLYLQTWAQGNRQ